MSKSKKKSRIIKWIVIVLILLLVIGGVVYSKIVSKNAPMNIVCTSGIVKKQDLAQYVTFSGTVSGKNSMTVTGDPTLKVLELNVKKGDTVKKGDVLCIFDSTSLQEEFDVLSENNTKAQGAQDYTHGINQRNLENARRDKASALSKAQQDINDAVAKRDKAYDDYNSGVEKYNEINRNIEKVFTEMYEAENEDVAKAKEAEWEGLKAQAAALNTELESAHAMLSSYDDAITAARRVYDDVEKSADNIIQNAQDTIDKEKYSNTDTSTSERLKKLNEQIEKCTVIAPMDGIISELNISKGSTPFSSDIITISDASSLIVTGKVNETDILSLKEGMSAEVTTNATGDEIIEGKVTRIERISSGGTAEIAGGYTVEVAVSDSSQLLIGMSASAKIILDQVSDVLSIPYDSINIDDNDESYVWLASPVENGSYKVSKVLVKTGFEGDYYTEIASGSLNKGDKVITGTYNISDGDVVNIDTSED